MMEGSEQRDGTKRPEFDFVGTNETQQETVQIRY